MKSVIILLAFVAMAAAIDNCVTVSSTDASKCYECAANFDQFNGACVATTCRTNLASLNMAEFGCHFWSVVNSGSTAYVGTVNVTSFNVDSCYTYTVVLDSHDAANNEITKDYTSVSTKTWDTVLSQTVFQWTVPHSDILPTGFNCPSASSTDSAGNNYITYTCTFIHTISFQGFVQTVYTFTTTIKVNTGVANSISLTVTKLSATNTCCTVYTSVTSKIEFIDSVGGAVSTVTTFAKNTNWFNRVSITDVAYQVYYLQHVKATLGSTSFFYTLTPVSSDNSHAGHIDYNFLATMATNAAVTLTITNTVTVAQAGRLLQSTPLATTSTSQMTINGSNSALLNTFAAMLLVVLALFAF